MPNKRVPINKEDLFSQIDALRAAILNKTKLEYERLEDMESRIAQLEAFFQEYLDSINNPK